MSSNKFHTTCVTVAPSRNSFPELERLGTNFDKVAAISDKIETNRNSPYMWAIGSIAAISDKIETNRN